MRPKAAGMRKGAGDLAFTVMNAAKTARAPMAIGAYLAAELLLPMAFSARSRFQPQREQNGLRSGLSVRRNDMEAPQRGQVIVGIRKV